MENASPEPNKESSDDGEITPVRPHRSADSSRGLPSRQLVGVGYLHVGPLPSPEVLKGYDLVQPGLAERIVTMAEKQATHRQLLEKTVIIGDHRKSWFGLVLGFFLSVGILYGGYDLVKKDHDVAGTIMGGAGISSLIGIFVYGSNQRVQERDRKAMPPSEDDSEIE